jgi:hypothetical protein
VKVVYRCHKSTRPVCTPAATRVLALPCLTLACPIIPLASRRSASRRPSSPR